jgi:DNA polymerase-3 subunit delta'
VHRRDAGIPYDRLVVTAPDLFSPDLFREVPEQAAAKQLLSAALTAGPANAYLLHGPTGVRKTAAARAFAAGILGDAELLGGRRTVHPDLYVVEPLGEMIRIDEIRAMRHDLHLRPFEADRRVYLILAADLMNDEAADALLKDLEEPPDYATIVLVADELGPLPETIRSRCQLVPFHRLSDAAVREWLASHAPELDDATATAIVRSAGGRLDRAERLLDQDASRRRDALIAVARSVYLDDTFEPRDAAAVVLAAMSEAGAAAKEAEEAEVARRELAGREAEQRLRRAQRGAERDELLASLEGFAAWYRDLVVVSAGAEQAAAHADRLAELRADEEYGVAAERAAELVCEAWRVAEEFNVSAALALEALFVRLRRTFG